MSNHLLVRLHAVAGGLAMVTILAFIFATLSVEALGTVGAIATVKTAIMWGLLILVPAMAVAGASGFRLAKGRLKGIIGRKAVRMRVIAANGLLVLLPSAVFLAWKARAGNLDTTFALVQGLEIVAGLINLALLGLNMRDGLILQRARRAMAVRA
jgi:hypothetical protein